MKIRIELAQSIEEWDLNNSNGPLNNLLIAILISFAIAIIYLSLIFYVL